MVGTIVIVLIVAVEDDHLILDIVQCHLESLVIVILEDGLWSIPCHKTIVKRIGADVITNGEVDRVRSLISSSNLNSVGKVRCVQVGHQIRHIKGMAHSLPLIKVVTLLLPLNDGYGTIVVLHERSNGPKMRIGPLLPVLLPLRIGGIQRQHAEDAATIASAVSTGGGTCRLAPFHDSIRSGIELGPDIDIIGIDVHRDRTCRFNIVPGGIDKITDALAQLLMGGYRTRSAPPLQRIWVAGLLRNNSRPRAKLVNGIPVGVPLGQPRPYVVERNFVDHGPPLRVARTIERYLRLWPGVDRGGVPWLLHIGQHRHGLRKRRGRPDLPMPGSGWGCWSCGGGSSSGSCVAIECGVIAIIRLLLWFGRRERPILPSPRRWRGRSVQYHHLIIAVIVVVGVGGGIGRGKQ
mmetsp:Transcript_22324/g.64086  ORF Transcript_22324/g.64086 Transcript_22324/m.64086 type:complete len:406 (-) Transcript_22324:1033-2250(-)